MSGDSILQSQLIAYFVSGLGAETPLVSKDFRAKYNVIKWQGITINAGPSEIIVGHVQNLKCPA